jgi:AAA family ATP:ADP antiporter
MSHQSVLGNKFFRNTLWPIFPHEVRRIMPLSLLMFLVCLDYSMLRCMKDTVVITASTAAVIPFIKVWTLLPMAVLFTYIYAKISSAYSRKTTFYLIVSAFLAFFLVFAFVLYPNSEATHLRGIAQVLRGVLPAGLSGLIAMIEYWSFTLFYIISELWSNIVLSILTWGFINEITSLKEAPRFYTVLSLASNVAAVAAGLCANLLVSEHLSGDWQQSLQYMILTIVASAVVAMVLYHRIDKDLKREHQDPEEGAQKIKFSLQESISTIKQSKHLIYLTIIVISYFFVINTVEVIWKEQLRIAYPSPSDFNYYMNTLTAWIGVISTILGMFVGVLISKFGWTKTALATPMVMLFTSLLFFIFIVFESDLMMLTSLLGTTPLAIAVFLGAMQNCLSKGAKYSVFDSTKEMAFIPLPRTDKIKGKAIIDGIASRLGKSGASFSLQVTILMLGSLVASTPYITALMLMVLTGWISATRLLGRIVDAKLDESGGKEMIGEEEIDELIFHTGKTS